MNLCTPSFLFMPVTKPKVNVRHHQQFKSPASRYKKTHTKEHTTWKQKLFNNWVFYYFFKYKWSRITTYCRTKQKWLKGYTHLSHKGRRPSIKVIRNAVAICSTFGKGLKKTKCPAVRKFSGISAKSLFLIVWKYSIFIRITKRSGKQECLWAIVFWGIE